MFLAVAVRHIWHRFTQPAPNLDNDDERYRSRMLASVLVILLVLTIFIIVPIWLLLQPDFALAPPVGVLFVGFLTLAYVMNRLGFVNTAGFLLVIMLPVVITIIMLTGTPTSGERIGTLNFLLVSILITSLIFKARATLLMIALSLGLSLGLLQFHRTPVTETYSILVFTGIMSSLVFLVVKIQSGIANQLRQSEFRYRSLFEQSSDAVFILNVDGQHVAANPRALELLGYTREELLQMTNRDVVVATEHDHSEEMRHRLLAKERIPPYERLFRRKDGTFVPVEVSVQLVVDSNGNPLQIQSIVRDISERKRSEARNQAFLQDMKALQTMNLELTQIEDLTLLYQRMVELSHERLNIERLGLFLINSETNELVGTFGIDTNGKLRDERSYRETITPDHWTHEIFDAPEHARFWVDVPVYDNGKIVGHGSKAASALWDGHEPIGYLVTDNFMRREDPRPYQSELVSILGSTFGHLIRLKQATARLRENEERLNMIVSAAELNTWDWDLLEDKLVLNEQWVRSFGYEANEFSPTRNWARSLTHPDDIDAVSKDFNAHLKGEIPLFVSEHRMRTKWGEWKWVFNTGKVVERDVLGTPLRATGIHLDITQRKAFEQNAIELRVEQERMRLLSRFVQDASHEFRTPLATIQTGLYLLNRSSDPEIRQRKTQQIEDQIARITDLVDQLLILARLDSGDSLTLDHVDVNRLVEEAVRTQQSAADEGFVTIETEFHRAPIVAYVDSFMLQQAIGNVVENAIRYTGQQGKVTVKTACQDRRCIIEISDTGAGIEPDALPHIFERFYRHDESHSTPGFGLGLPIALRIVERHGGRIDVESTPGKGSSFKFMLPLGQV